MTPDIRLERNGEYWRARWTDRDGAKRSRGLGHIAKVTQRQAERAVVRLEREMAKSPALRNVGQSPTLSQWRERYESLREHELAPETLQLHLGTLDELIEQLGDKQLVKVTPRHAGDMRAHWQARKLSEATVCRKVREAKRIWRVAMREGAAAESPWDGLASNVRVDGPDFIPADEQVDALIEAAPSPGWRCLLALCALGGLRRGEAMALGWEGVRFGKSRLVVAHIGTRTTKKRTREVLLEDRLADILRAAQTIGLPRPTSGVSPNNLNRDIAVVFKAAGLTRWPKPYQTLRYWRATTWRDKYPEHVVDAWLGHGPEVARKHYVKVPEAYYRGEADATAALRAEVERLRKELEAKS